MESVIVWQFSWEYIWEFPVYKPIYFKEIPCFILQGGYPQITLFIRKLQALFPLDPKVQCSLDVSAKCVAYRPHLKDFFKV